MLTANDRESARISRGFRAREILARQRGQLGDWMVESKDFQEGLRDVVSGFLNEVLERGSRSATRGRRYGGIQDLW